ncbi:MAG: type IX secretion system membrane protein PorP/SprF [Bacteroidota bacterium]
MIKKITYKTVATFLLLSFAWQASAQDMQFAQYYSAPLYLNPAFTGANVCGRLSTNVRNQWPSIPGGYVSEMVSFDHYLVNNGVGLGVLFTNDRAGSGRLRSTGVYGSFAYELVVNRNLGFRFGMQGGIINRSVNFYDLLFGDQIARGNASISIENPAQAVTIADFNTGMLVFSKKYWAGMSFHHITNPNESLLGAESRLPMKFSLHGGTKILVSGDADDSKTTRYISPTFNLRSQAKFDQLDIGCYLTRDKLNIGLWYRGIPLFKAYQKGYPNNDAIVVIAGVTLDRFNIGYSYDHTISWLRGLTGGAHELSLSYQFCKMKKRKRKAFPVECPKF